MGVGVGVSLLCRVTLSWIITRWVTCTGYLRMRSELSGYVERAEGRWMIGVGSRRALVVGGLVWAFLLVGAAGALAQPAFVPVAGSPFASASALSVAFSPSGGLLAVANSRNSTVSVFTVAPDGALHGVVGSPFATGQATYSVAFSPSGGLLATANAFDSTVSMFSVATDGSLHPVAGSPFRTGTRPFSVAFSPSGGLLATANEGALTVSVFSVAAGGALRAALGSPFAVGKRPVSVAFSPSGGLLATANEDTVSVFKVAASGALAAVAGSPFATGGTPESVAFSPSGGLLATVNGGASSVAVFSVGSDGSLHAVARSPFATGLSPDAVAFSPAGGLLATANHSGSSVSVFSVGTDGSLHAVAGSPFAAGSGPSSMAFSPSGGLLAVGNLNGNSVSVFSKRAATAPHLGPAAVRITSVRAVPLQPRCAIELGRDENAIHATVADATCRRFRLTLWGMILSAEKLKRAATGTVHVRVSVKLPGGRATRVARANVRHGRWRTSLVLPGVNLDPVPPSYLIIARYGGDNTTQPAATSRRVRLESERAGL